jgi:alpha-glucosidase
MRDISLGRNQILDPLGKRYWPFYKGRDGSRSPMQWDASPFYGFRSTEPWIPLNPDYTSRNVLAQHADQKSILNFYRSLIAIRHKVPSLQGGEFVALSLKPIHVLAYLRKIRGQMVLVVLNFSDHPQSLDLNPDIAQRKWELLLSTSQETVDPISANRLKLGPLEVLLLLIMEKE